MAALALALALALDIAGASIEFDASKWDSEAGTMQLVDPKMSIAALVDATQHQWILRASTLPLLQMP